MAEMKIKGGNAGAERLSLEIGAKVLALFRGSSVASKALFVGMEPGRYLVFSVPGSAALEPHLAKGNAVNVRFAGAGEVFSFDSRVIGRLVEQSVSLVVLDYPVAARPIEMRRETRSDSYCPAVLNVGKESHPGSVVDLSAGGCRFIFARAGENFPGGVTAGREVSVSFQMPGRENAQLFACRIGNFGHEKSLLSVGLRFDLKGEATFSADMLTDLLK